VAEAWQKRRYPAHFVSKLSDADGEQAETEHWISTASACGYISYSEHERLLAEYLELGRRLGATMAIPEKFCGKS
jgi:four helix bundle protein